MDLPGPGKMLPPGDFFDAATILGLTIYPENPLEFGFIIDFADETFEVEAMREESRKLIKYFLAALTIAEDDMWVNLSPYEQERVISPHLGKTELGRDMLAQDYVLKQLTSSMMYPEDELGGAFWKRVYDKAYKLYGTTDIPMNTFNKIWIIPESAEVFEAGTRVFITDSRLKVMLEEDFMALEKNIGNEKFALQDVTADQAQAVSGVASEVVREILIPEIEWEVNHGRHFAKLRQIYHAMILSSWFKQTLKESLLGKVYVNQNKVKGVESPDPEDKDKIYRQYVKAFEEGVYNYIREDYDIGTRQMIPRKYFSGGETFAIMASEDFIEKSGVRYDPKVTYNWETVLRINAMINAMPAGRQGVLAALENANAAEFLVHLFAPGEQADSTTVGKIKYGEFDQNPAENPDRAMLSDGYLSDAGESIMQMNWRGRNLNNEKKLKALKSVANMAGLAPSREVENIMGRIKERTPAWLMIQALKKKHDGWGDVGALEFIAYAALNEEEMAYVDTLSGKLSLGDKLRELKNKRIAARQEENEKKNQFLAGLNRVGENMVELIKSVYILDDWPEAVEIFQALVAKVGFRPTYYFKVNTFYEEKLTGRERRILDAVGMRSGLINALDKLLLLVYAGLNKQETRFADELSDLDGYKGKDNLHKALRKVKELRDLNERFAGYNKSAQETITTYLPLPENITILTQVEFRETAYNLFDQMINVIYSHVEEGIGYGKVQEGFIKMGKEKDRRAQGIIDEMRANLDVGYDGAIDLLFVAGLDEEGHKLISNLPESERIDPIQVAIEYLTRKKLGEIKLDYKNAYKNNVLRVMVPFMLTRTENEIITAFNEFTAEIGLQRRANKPKEFYSRLSPWKKSVVDRIVVSQSAIENGQFKDKTYSVANALEYIAVAGLSENEMNVFERQTNTGHNIGVRLRKMEELLAARRDAGDLFPTMTDWLAENIALRQVKKIISEKKALPSDDLEAILNEIRDILVGYVQDERDHLDILEQVSQYWLGREVVDDIDELDKKGALKALGISFSKGTQPLKQIVDYLAIATLSPEGLKSFLEQQRGTVTERLMNVLRPAPQPAAKQPVVIRRRKGDNAQFADGEKPGGIDLDPALLDLQIKRDKAGIPLPLFEQPIEDMRIEGFIPVIIDVTPIQSIPLLLGMANLE